jgi:hypothetical protein
MAEGEARPHVYKTPRGKKILFVCFGYLFSGDGLFLLTIVIRSFLAGAMHDGFVAIPLVTKRKAAVDYGDCCICPGGRAEWNRWPRPQIARITMPFRMD